jgi:hypothetical protein
MEILQLIRKADILATIILIGCVLFISILLLLILYHTFSYILKR